MSKSTTKSSWTPAAVKQAYNRNPDSGHFFDRDTMRFFGDRMSSYRCVCVDGIEYMIRKPTATVNVFGKIQTAGKTYFGCWLIVDNGGRIDVDIAPDDVKAHVYATVFGGQS